MNEANKKLNDYNLGKPVYESPEFTESQFYCLKNDIWSTACVIYELIYLKSPFKFEDLLKIKMEFKCPLLKNDCLLTPILLKYFLLY